MILHPGVKINLGLNILRKRPDGYHDLETLFVPVSSLHDTLEVVTGEGYGTTADHIREAYEPAQREQAISADGKLMITVARQEGVHWDPLHDLCAKAYFLLAEDFKLPPMKIFLEKNSPVGAGLGGGSADAAFTLRAINELCGLNLSDASLAAYAARLGADCPFFIYNRPMFASGRGEILEEFDLPGAFGVSSLSRELPFRVELVIPEGISVSTAEAYRGVTPALPPVPLREVLLSPSTWKENLRNDFEASVFALHPELAALKADLYARGAFYAAMSGSGSALFGLFAR
jgi:4-diphosphocytidyl-2-C-methyl-D-erythritol kinase